MKGWTKIKHLSKRLFDLFKFINFENSINATTWKRHSEILAKSIDMAENFNEIEPDSPITTLGKELRDNLLKEFKNKYEHLDIVRILIHVPSKKTSPGGYSVFSNLAESLKYIGIETELLDWEEDIDSKLTNFKPTVFMTSNNTAYLNRINWDCIREYRINNSLRIGLTASVDDFRSQDPNIRLNWLKSNSIDFFYGFRSPEYFRERPDYKVITNVGYHIFSLEFGANPLLYYPVAGINKDLDYVFLASSNSDKRKRYLLWLPKVFKNFSGFIDGPGWHKIEKWSPQKSHKYIYARAKVGINLHIDDSINWASELNERTYILAACGVPQLIDNAKLLPLRFSERAMFIAHSPKEYAEKFEYILEHPEEAEKRALNALREVYDKHTTFHRAEFLVKYLVSFE